VATSTLAKAPNSHQLLADTMRPFAPPNRPKPQPEFMVSPTGRAEYHWRIVALATDRTISRHKSLIFALRKCNRLNEQRDETQLDPLKVALSGFPDVNSYRAYYEGVGNEFD
jgi:hypothetical protein